MGTYSVGLEHIDLQECNRRGVKVGYTPDVLTDAVAEETIALTLTTARRFKEGENHLAFTYTLCTIVQFFNTEAGHYC